MSGAERKTGDEHVAAYWLSDNGMTLVIKRRTPGGILTSIPRPGETT